MSKAIVNPHKLKRLPQHVQDAIGTLNDAQLATLQAAFTHFVTFDLLGLPLEIRLMIYREVMSGSSHPRLMISKTRKFQGFELLLVNKQISSEALMSLRENKVLRISTWVLDSLSRSQKQTLQFFRKFDLHLGAQSPTDPDYSIYLYNDPAYITKVVAEVIRGHEKNDGDAVIDLKVTVEVKKALKPFLDKIEWQAKPVVFQEGLEEALSMYEQLQHLCIKGREMLHKRLPNASFRTNVDCTWIGVEARWLGKGCAAFRALPPSSSSYKHGDRTMLVVKNHWSQWEIKPAEKDVFAS